MSQQDAYLRCLRRLAALGKFGVDLGLHRMEALLSSLGDPHLEMVTVHLAGTNGKGSTAAMIEGGVRAAGLRTGLYTSPHLCRFTERIQVAGREIQPSRLAALVDEVLAAAPHGTTFFEAATAAALLHFRHQGVKVAVLETGLGGRLDATNLVRPALCVITDIALDHTEVLGETLAEIAQEKAGIFKPGVPVVAAMPADASVREVLEQRAAELGCALRWGGAGETSFLRRNRALARLAGESLAAAGHLDQRQRYLEGVAAARWPGRLERLDCGAILDGAHNPAGARALASALAGQGPFTVVLGMLSPRDPGPVIRALAPLAARYLCTAPRSPRAIPAGTLLRHAPPTATAAPTLDMALEQARTHPEPLLVTGSLYLVGEARAVLLGEPTDPLDAWDPLEKIVSSVADAEF